MPSTKGLNFYYKYTVVAVMQPTTFFLSEHTAVHMFNSVVKPLTQVQIILTVLYSLF